MSQQLRYFKPQEFKMDGVVVFDKMDPGFLKKLDECRHQSGVSMSPSSSFRTPEKNKAVGGSFYSLHLLGRAVDVPVSNGSDRCKIVRAALSLGLSVGIMENAIHLDDREDQILFHYYGKQKETASKK